MDKELFWHWVILLVFTSIGVLVNWYWYDGILGGLVVGGVMGMYAPVLMKMKK